MGRSILAKAAIAAFAAFAAFAIATPANADDVLKNITFTLQPQYTTNTGAKTVADQLANGNQAALAKGNPSTTHAWELNYSARYQISRKYSVVYLHTTLDQAIESLSTYFPPLGQLTSGNLRDRFDSVYLNNTPNAHLTQSLYYVHRSRMCCPADNQAPAGSYGGVDQTDYRLGEAYKFGPRTKIGYPLTASIALAYTNHPSAAAYGPNTTSPYSAVGGPYPNGGTQYQGSGFNIPSYGLRADLPTGDRTWTPFVSYTQGGTSYRKDPGMWNYHYITYGFNKVLTKNLVLTSYSFDVRQFAGQSYLTVAGGHHDSLREALWITQLNYFFKLK